MHQDAVVDVLKKRSILQSSRQMRSANFGACMFVYILTPGGSIYKHLCLCTDNKRINPDVRTRVPSRVWPRRPGSSLHTHPHSLPCSVHGHTGGTFDLLACIPLSKAWYHAFESVDPRTPLPSCWGYGSQRSIITETESLKI